MQSWPYRGISKAVRVEKQTKKKIIGTATFIVKNIKANKIVM